MPRNKVVYDKAELERPVNFVICIADRMLDASIIDYEEATSYVTVHHRRALIVSDSKAFTDLLSPVHLENVMNMTTPAAKIVNTLNKPYTYVYERLLKLYRNGLLICGRDTLTNDIASTLATARGIGLDVVLHRDNLIQISEEEKRRVNFVRFHYNTLSAFSPEHVSVLASYYGQHEGFGLLLSQFIVNSQHEAFEKYFNEQSKKYVLMGFNNFVNNVEHDRQAAYYVYYDLVHNKIIGVSRKNFEIYVRKFVETLKIGHTDEELNQIISYYYD